jgi:hypothetical protein
MDLSVIKNTINNILEIVKGIPAKAGGFFGKTSGISNGISIGAKGFFDKIKELFFVLTDRINSELDKIFDRIGPNKKKPVLIGFGALVALLLILGIAGLSGGAKKTQRAAPDAASASLTIPVEELFIPAEPDFLPAFVFDREKRRFWSLEDIRPYWKTPDSGDIWREEIKSAVDKLMEGIP